MIIFGTCLLLSFSACDNNLPDEEEEYESTYYWGKVVSGWPPAAILAEHGISGMPRPVGATEISWYEEAFTSYTGIVIRFVPGSGTGESIQNWFINQDWIDLYYSNTVAHGIFLKFEYKFTYDIRGITGSISGGRQAIHL